MTRLINSMIKEENVKTTKLQNRKVLLRSAIICAKRGQSLEHISKQLGTITHDDFMYIEGIVSKFKNPQNVQKITLFLCENLNGFKQTRDIYFYALHNGI